MNFNIRYNGKEPTSVTAVIGNKVYSADKTHPNWAGVLAAVRSNSDAAFVGAVNIRKAVANYVKGKVRIEGNEVYFGTLQIGGIVVDRLLNFIGDQLPPEPILRFIENLYANPSQRAVTELYTFLEHKNMPTTPEGNFLAYKGLQPNFYSITSGKLTLLQGKTDKAGHIFNGIGETIECVRNQVDDNKDIGCSRGIHAGSLEYATSFAGGGKVVIVEINPKDVVSIPTDCNCQKLRTCKYKVVGEYVAPLNDTFNNQYSDVDTTPENGSDEDTDDDEYECGYSHGYEIGEADKTANKAFDLTYEDGFVVSSDAWENGYTEGFNDTADAGGSVLVNRQTPDFLKGYGRGYDKGINDKANHKVNWLVSADHIEPSCDFHAGYDEGYDAGFSGMASVY